MERRILKRYLILLVALILCAGAAWVAVNGAHNPHENAVLAYKNEDGYRIAELCQRKAVRGGEAPQPEKAPGVEVQTEKMQGAEADREERMQKAEMLQSGTGAGRWQRWQTCFI